MTISAKDIAFIVDKSLFCKVQYKLSVCHKDLSPSCQPKRSLNDLNMVCFPIIRAFISVSSTISITNSHKSVSSV